MPCVSFCYHIDSSKAIISKLNNGPNLPIVKATMMEGTGGQLRWVWKLHTEATRRLCWFEWDCPPQTDVFEHLIPNRWFFFRRLGPFRRLNLAGGSASLGMRLQGLRTSSHVPVLDWVGCFLCVDEMPSASSCPSCHVIPSQPWCTPLLWICEPNASFIPYVAFQG